jgi:hypothetical protein
MPTRPHFRLTKRTSQRELGTHDAVRLPKIHPNLFLSSMAAAERVVGSNVSKFCIAGKPVSAYMGRDHARHSNSAAGRRQLAATQSYVVANDTLAIDQAKFDRIFKLAAQYIQDVIHDRLTLVHCFAGINRSTTSIIAWWIMFGDKSGRCDYSGSDSETDSDDSGFDSDDSGSYIRTVPGCFTEWTQLRDYIRDLNRQYRNKPALSNPQFEKLLHGFNAKYNSETGSERKHKRN